MTDKNSAENSSGCVSQKNGVLLVNKRRDITSFDVLRELKKEFPKGTALGHAGTLDPFATGLLVVLVGKATKLSPFLLSSKKTYRAVMKFGVATDSGDLTGAVVQEAAVSALGLEELSARFTKFCANYTSQTPPMYSAKKQDGIKLYELARQGIEVHREAVSVALSDAKALNWDAPHFEFEVTCTAGTYIRTLAEDFAKSRGSVAHLVELHRIASGNFSVENASKFIEFDDVLDRKTGIEVGEETALALAQGKSLNFEIPEEKNQNKNWVPIFSSGKLIAVWDRAEQRSMRVFLS